SLLDHLIDPYLPLLEDLSKQADILELDVLKKSGLPDDRSLLQDLNDLRRSLQALCRITAHQRDALGRLAHGTFKEIPAEALPYFRDIHDHFVQAADQVETYREVINTAMDAFLALQSNRMNATMKTLATISTIMLPLSFIASLYGMNFRYMPELQWRYGYPFALGLMVVVGTSLVLWFRKRHWL
ncbi:MAG TPA: CorA family divalent cation transporter, partial [Candidatus Xenobia bacterium]